MGSIFQLGDTDVFHRVHGGIRLRAPQAEEINHGSVHNRANPVLALPEGDQRAGYGVQLVSLRRSRTR